MSIANTIQRNTSWIKLDKDMLFYDFKVGDHFYNCENREFHISTNIKRKYTPHEDMLKEFGDNPRDQGTNRKKKIKTKIFKLTGSKNLTTPEYFMNSLMHVMGEESFMVCQKHACICLSECNAWTHNHLVCNRTLFI